MDAESVKEYLTLMQQQYEEPLVKENFGLEGSNQDSKQEHRIEAIKSYSLS